MRYITGILIAIGLVVLMIILIVKAFSGDGSIPEKKQIDLNSYANTSAVVQMTIDGPINARQEHRQIRITVGRDETELEIVKGYDNNVIKRRTFDNSQEAYATFLHALEVADFTEGNPDPLFRDERGYCPTGERFIFKAISGDSTVLRWWKTSCGEGNFGGRSDVIRNLFKAQIPDYPLLTIDTHLY